MLEILKTWNICHWKLQPETGLGPRKTTCAIGKGYQIPQDPRWYHIRLQGLAYRGFILLWISPSLLWSQIPLSGQDVFALCHFMLRIGDLLPPPPLLIVKKLLAVLLRLWTLALKSVEAIRQCRPLQIDRICFSLWTDDKPIGQEWNTMVQR